jgi:hypothetical protein
MAKTPRTDREAEVVGGLFTCAVASAELATKTDAEIAKLLLDHVWANMSMLSVESELVSQAVERLERSGGGPNPDDGKD